MNISMDVTASLLAEGWKVIYTTKDGQTWPAKSFMSLPPLHAGYVWYDGSALGAGYAHWIERPAPLTTDDKLFGYDADAFMRKQYK